MRIFFCWKVSDEVHKKIHFFNLEKYIQQFGEIHSAIWGNTFSNLGKYPILKLSDEVHKKIHFFSSIWRNTLRSLGKYQILKASDEVDKKIHFFTLEKYIHQFEKKYQHSIWRNTFINLGIYQKCHMSAQKVAPLLEEEQVTNVEKMSHK